MNIRSKLLLGIISILLVLFIFWIILQNAWISDDAYITFRVIENFIAGYGPNFNIGERVQVFTHPLWMVLLAGEYYVFRHLPFVNFIPLQLYYLTTFTSLFLSFLTVVLLVWKVAPNWISAIVGLTILTFSRSFIHYSTSGLENPLSHLILVLFLYFILVTPKRIFLISLLAGLGILTRQDYLLLFLPCLLYLVISSNDKKRVLLDILAGLSPVLLWEIFSVFYYGFPFPNTAYAKLNTNLDRFTLLKSGYIYFQDLLVRDRITFLVIMFAVAVSLVSKNKERQLIATGLILYLAYILWIGGDFMSGRFFSAPLILSVGLLVMEDKIYPSAYIWIAVAVVMIGLTSPNPPILQDPRIGIEKRLVFVYKDQVTDERAYYYPRTGLLIPNKIFIEKRFPRPENWVFDPTQYQVRMLNDLGMKGYSAGPNVHVFDFYALSDPLLARLPSNPDTSTIGHFARALPLGYIETLISGKNQIADQNLATYYDKLHLIISGELFDPKRLREIVNMNLGKYDHLIAEYTRRNSQQ